ncbi:MAG TPA: cytochrome c biogenesis protein CcsA [Tepidisphaeraceae bacterium]|jgi:ABC-type uncharacterized transport system permease subunit
MPPTTGQLALLVVAMLLYAAGGVLSVVRAWSDTRRMHRVSRVFLGTGIVASLGVIVWHAGSRRSWLPIEDNFDALVWLATLLAIFTLYVHHNRPLGGLDWFVMPVVLVLLMASLFVGKTEYRPYVTSTWSWVHRVTILGGVIGFAIAAASGAMYVLTSQRLRQKEPVSPFFGSLERTEHLTMTAVTLGFALLTIGLVTGGVLLLAGRAHTPTIIVLAGVVWLIYAVVLHAPINPSFRGRKVAVLSMVGFVLMLGTLVTVLLIPGAPR